MVRGKRLTSAGNISTGHLYLLCSVFLISSCGLIYELVSGTLASYLLGDSVTQFSTIIGVYLFAMGIGSWLSGYIEHRLLLWFIRIEILVGIVGGLSAPLLFLLFEFVTSFRIVLYSIVGITGVLVGLEIPLLMRILKANIDFKDLVARVFTFDYTGALLASLIFPLVLAPALGLIRTSLLFGMFNMFIAVFLLYQFREAATYRRGLLAVIITCSLPLLAGFIFSDRIMTFAESLAFQDKVIYSKSTPYQRIVLTKNMRDLRLFLNGNLQFSSADEYRYHEALVHPAMQASPNAANILILGGGDGLALREVFKYPSVTEVTLVDLDPAMTKLFSTNPMLTSLNNSSLNDRRLKVINSDAFTWVRQNHDLFDCIIVDFPDPSNYSIGKLYTDRFYRELKNLLSEEGTMVVQSTSPYYARKSFWCVNHTMASSGLVTKPYHLFVPSFGEWGFVFAANGDKWRPAGQLPSSLKYINAGTIDDMTHFPPDMAEMPTEINKLNDQRLITYFDQEWSTYVH